MSIGKFFKTASHFLFSQANRELLVFLAFLALAGVFWLLMTLDETYEQEVRIPLRYTNIPKNVLITSDKSDTIKVVVSDKGISLLTFMYGRDQKYGEINFTNYAGSNGAGTVSNADLLKITGKILPASAKIVSIKPEVFTFYYNYGEKRKVPVKWKGKVAPDDLYFLSETKYTPDSITIYASHDKLNKITEVYTEELNYANFHDTLTIQASLKKIPGVKMVPNQVDIRFVTDILTEEGFDDIPIEGINMPKGKVLRTFPAKVKIYFVTGMKRYQTLTANDFMVVADYDEFSKSTDPKCNIYLRKSPDGISKVKLETTQVDYLIEEQ